MAADAAGERDDGTPPGEDQIAARMRAECLRPHGWGNGPGDTYGWHEHGYEKVLYCVRGRIVFHTAGGVIELGPGDKMVLPPRVLTPGATARPSPPARPGSLPGCAPSSTPVTRQLRAAPCPGRRSPSE